MCRSAVELAEFVRARELSARELVQTSLDAIAARDPRIHAFTHVAVDQALADADQIDATQSAADADERPFAGVPIAIKDNRAVAGMPLTNCSDIFGDFSPRWDAAVVARLRAAGFVVVGKTALPEMGILPTTESRRFGPTANPWDLGRTPGGSSGASASAVAARMVPMAHGNDGAGSIRIPAAMTGTVGLKSTRARVSNGPFLGEAWAGLAHEGAITRTVRDAALALDVMAGAMPGDPYGCPPPSRPYVAEVGADPGRLRVGVMTAIGGFDTDPDCVTAVESVGALLAELGHDVEAAHPPALDTWVDMLGAFNRVLIGHVAVDLAMVQAILEREVADDELEPLTRYYLELARRQTPVDYLLAVDELRRWARAVAGWWSGPYDLLLSPTVAAPPAPLGTLNFDPATAEPTFRKFLSYLPYTPAFNVTGQPAISLPLEVNAAGLPIGVQLVADTWREDLLLRVAAQLEAARPWADRRPALAT
jgi:amidase